MTQGHIELFAYYQRVSLNILRDIGTTPDLAPTHDYASDNQRIRAHAARWIYLSLSALADGDLVLTLDCLLLAKEYLSHHGGPWPNANLDAASRWLRSRLADSLETATPDIDFAPPTLRSGEEPSSVA